jgi:hypothetical protein
MRLSECIIGLPVKTDSLKRHNNIGHIIGFSKNSTNEIIVDIQMTRIHNRDGHNRVAFPPKNISRLI